MKNINSCNTGDPQYSRPHFIDLAQLVVFINLSMYGFLMIPISVMMAVMYWWGMTSKAGLRYSMGILAPKAHATIILGNIGGNN
jgi:hypothetical protein